MQVNGFPKEDENRGITGTIGKRENIDDERLAVEINSRSRTRRSTEETKLRFPPGYVRGTSDAASALYSQIRSLAESDLPVLIVGETGVGKDVYARTLHLSSPRSSAPFVAINCTAIPAEMLEAELFGIGRNVATGVAARSGKFEMARGGTLFLDEIAEMPPELQAKLLRALQEKEIQPVGGEPIEIDLRVLSATNVNVPEQIAAGSFRRDLFYRLAGFILQVPPLRRRRDDIPKLVEHFLQRDGEAAARWIRGLTVGALERLQNCLWPGNVRQLEHEIRRLIYLCEPGEIIRTALLSEEVLTSQPIAHGFAGPDAAPTIGGEALPTLNLADLEKRALREALRISRGRQTEAARRLGISRFSLRRRIERYNL